MSHGVAGAAPAMEPNLTPLLDMVLQLLMFFMMCVNFVTEQVSEDVKLPVSQSARPMDKTESDVLFLNLKPFKSEEFRGRYRDNELQKFQEGDPCVLALLEPPMKLNQVQYFHKQKYAEPSRN